MTVHSALMAKRGWSALSAFPRKNICSYTLQERNEKEGRSELPELMWCLREVEKEIVERQEAREMKRRKLSWRLRKKDDKPSGRWKRGDRKLNRKMRKECTIHVHKFHERSNG